MYELIDSMIKAMEKDAVVSKNKPRTAQSLRRAITELATQENAKVPVERRVTRRDVEVVASRSLNKTAGLERSSRFFAAYKEVASFVALATTGKSPTHVTQNRDLLPIGHPLSTRGHAMTASAYSEAVARWIAADPRIHDDARPIVAAAYALSADSVEYKHAIARLLSLEPGMVPRELLVSGDPTPITASFMGWIRRVFGGGNSRIARSLRAKAQLRDREGKFAEQGGGLQFYARMPNGSIKSKVGNHAGNAENGTDFLVEISGDPDIPDGIYSVPASITKAVKAILPGDDAGTVSLPEGVEAVNVADLQRKDIPDGWKLIKEKGEGESGPDRVYATDDGYEVEVFDAGNYDKAVLQKAYRFNTGISGVPGSPVGDFTKRIDFEGRPNAAGKFDPSKPLYNLYRVETPETKRQAVIMAQRWSDIQQEAELDQDNFEKFYEASEKHNAEIKAKQEKSAAESKANQEAFEKNAAEVAKQNEQTRAEIDSNLANGLDPFGNKIPDGWTATKNDSALNPPYSMKVGDKEYVTTPIKKEDTVSYERTEQGYTGKLRHTPDGGLTGLYQNQEFKNWDEAEQGFAETVEADVNARRESALDAVEPYDESGELREMIENGANGEEVLEKIRENETWKQQESDYDTSWAVDLPSKVQKDKWAEFRKKRDAIENLPPEFTPFGGEKADEVKAELPEADTQELPTKAAADLKPGDKIIDAKGNVRTVKKNFMTDSGPMITFDDNKSRIYNDDDEVQLAPEEPVEEAPAAPEPEPTPEPAAPAKAEPKDVEWILPDGAYSLWKADEYEPEGRTDQESPDYTDDPKVLANKFSTDDLKDALAQAIIGVKDYATQFLDEFFDDLEDEEDGTAKKKPGPKKKKPKSKEASGWGQLDFDFGEEYVPAEAIYSALKEQGEDADMIAAELYDLPLGESKNVDMLEGLRTPEEVKAQEPSVILDDFDEDAMDVADTNIALAQGDAAATAVAQMNDVAEEGQDNPYINDIATDLNSTGVETNMQGMLDKYIALAISDDEDENQGYQALHSVLLSADGGLTIADAKDGEETMFYNAVKDALAKYNGSEPDKADVDVLFAKYGYYKDLILSKKAIAEGDESINDKNSKAGALYRLVVAGGKPTTKPLYRGIQVPLDSEAFEKYTTEGGIVSLDARSFADYPALAESFAGMLSSGNNDKASVIFTMPAGFGKALDITNVSPFGDERESLGFGNYRIAKLKVEKDPNSGKTLVVARLEALDKRGEVLEGLRYDYEDLLIENEQIELPDAYYSPSTEPFEVQEFDDETPEDEVDTIVSTSPSYIAKSYEMEDLIDAFRGAVEDGTGKVPLIDGENEYTADVEAVRDALQIQGINTNEVLKDIANAEPDVEAEEVDDEPIEPIADSPLDEIITEFGQEYDLEGFEQVGPQQGSNQGGTFKDAEGNEYYVKQPKSEDHRRNELLASAFYKLAGVNAAEMRFGSADDGEEKIFSSIIPGTTLADTDLTPEAKKQIQEGFAIDAWLANWDVAGLVNDNIIVDEDGNAFRIDTGGALLFRAMGAPKGSAFGNEVTELDTLRNAKMNPTSAALFGDMTDEDLKASAAKLLDISHTDIDNLVDATFDGDLAQELKDKLKARRNYILERFGLLGDDTSLIAETAKADEPEISDEKEMWDVEFQLLGSDEMWSQFPELDEEEVGDMSAEEQMPLWLEVTGLDKLGVEVVQIGNDDDDKMVRFRIPLSAKEAFGNAYGLDLDENIGSGIEKVGSAPDDEVEQPTPPAPEVPSEAPGNPYVTSDGVPIEPGMQLKYKKTGETVDFVKYDKGNSSYVYVKMADGSIKVKSTKQLESINGDGGPGGEEPTPEPEAPSAPEAPQEPTPEPEPEPEPEAPTEPEAGPDLSNYEKVDIRVDTLKVGDLLPQYYPIKNAEANLLKKRAADPNFELLPTDEIIGTYKASMPKKRGIKVRNLKTGKERYFEVNSNAKIYDVRRQLAEKPAAEPKPVSTPKNVNQVHNELVSSYDKVDISDDLRAAVKSYVSMSADINLGAAGEDVDPEVAKQIADLTKGIEDAPPLGTNVVLFRSLSGGAGKKILDLDEGDELYSPSFSSASLSVEKSSFILNKLDPDKVILEINAGPETKGLYIDAVARKKNELEYLLQRGTTLKVVEKGSFYEHPYYGDIPVVKAEIVRQEPESISTPKPEVQEAVTPEPTPAEPEITAQKSPVVIDVSGSVDDAVNQIKTAIENKETISFYYNGKVRNFKPESVWENEKNGKINAYGEDLGDGGKKKNFTVQLMEALPETSPNKPEAVEAQAPEAEPEPKKLQFHAQWIKDVMASKGVPISDEKAVEIRDIIDNNQLLEKWSSAVESELIEAIDEALGPDWNEAVGNTDFEVDEVDDPPISDDQRQIILSYITKLQGIQGFPIEKYVNQISNPSLTEADGAQMLQELEKYDDEIGGDAKVQAPGPDLEDLEGMDEGDESEAEAPALQPGAEVTDKKGNKGTVLKGPNKDNYVFVQFEDGKTGWRSAGSVSTTGQFNEGIKKAAPKKTTGKITPAGTKAVFVENPAGWDTSDFENVPALSDAIALVQNPADKFAAMKGASAAIDADSIEDLDVRIMRVRDQDGNDGLRFKFKLTSWAGNARTKELMDMTQEEREAQGVTKGGMVVDRIDVGPDGIGQISKDKNAYQGAGVTWTITTPEGIVVKLYRSNGDATSKVSADKYSSSRAFHNMVQIQAPADATNEQIADALRKAGVADVRPATKADAQVLVENRLMSVFDGKVDATKNPKGDEREQSLARIKQKYGITADDVIVSTGVSGRIETRLSPEGAKKIVEATGNPAAIQHNVSVPGFWGAEDTLDKTADWIAKLIGTPQGGLLSTTTRWTEGIGSTGMSSQADVGTGGADYVFTKPVKVAEAKTYGTSGVVMYFDPVKVYQRLDFYANSFDSYGKRVANQDVINAAKVGAYELMFKHRLSFDDLDSIVISTQAMRTAVIQKLRQMGITEIGGRPLEAVIVIGSQVKV